MYILHAVEGRKNLIENILFWKHLVEKEKNI